MGQFQNQAGLASHPRPTFGLVARCRSYKYLLQPTSHQKVALEKALSLNRELYNAALEERRGAWQWEQRSVSYFCLLYTSRCV